ncbi:unnamed protein product [Oikopleura dioica]|uniref:EF-hand domain-containing protein n=1 Tax=Oikopleura dioica TaxID=34765 RepID=E4XQ64_OIKDI|nr:unnamed protein product [Oikopleura dioica]CBY35752.1 unnamed protein product [Oikopleura dioica]
MARYLSQKQIDEFRECFNLYDRKNLNKISTRDVITVMRSLGTYPTKKEIESHFKTYDKKNGDDIEFSTFLNIMHQQLSQENAAKEILAAFKQSDWEKKGFVTVQEVRQILTRTGEKLTSRECDLLLRSANVQSNGYIKYDEFVSFITSPLPDY